MMIFAVSRNNRSPEDGGIFFVRPDIPFVHEINSNNRSPIPRILGNASILSASQVPQGKVAITFVKVPLYER